MDHKVSKDMISSGMIPSGEKTQADLGRIQYGSAPSPSSLMDAYKSIYEHHQKDKDGNTIPHEGEELNENLAGIAAKGLQMASRGARQVGKMAAQGSVKAKQLQAQGGVKKAVGDKLQSAKKKLALTSGQKEALLGRTTAGKITRGVAALGAANIAGRMASGEKKNDGYYYMQNFHYVPDGDTLSEDLFDALKSALIEEGCDEKTAIKVMASITPEFINENLKEENLNEIVISGTIAALAAKALAAAKASKVGLAAVKGAKAIKTAGLAFKKGLTTAGAKGASASKITTSGGKLASGATKVGKAEKAGQMFGSAGAAMKNNPTNTVLGATMVPGMLPQGAPPTPASQRAVTSGKRTAGMQRMDLDLFDVVKGQLLDEGLTEEEVLDVMTTLTIDEIKEGLMPTTLKGALVRGAVGAAGGVLAKKGLDKAKERIDDALNKARDKSPIGGNRRPGADKIYYGK